MSDNKREPKLLDIAKERRITVDDVPWLVKDFDVLYRVAEATLNNTTLAQTHMVRQDLRAQIARLRPAFEQIQELKAAILRRN